MRRQFAYANLARFMATPFLEPHRRLMFIHLCTDHSADISSGSDMFALMTSLSEMHGRILPNAHVCNKLSRYVLRDTVVKEDNRNPKTPAFACCCSLNKNLKLYIYIKSV